MLTLRLGEPSAAAGQQTGKEEGRKEGKSVRKGMKEDWGRKGEGKKDEGGRSVLEEMKGVERKRRGAERKQRIGGGEGCTTSER